MTVTGCQFYTRAFHKKWWGNAEAIAITSVARHADQPSGVIRNVTIANCRFRGENGIVLHGELAQPLQNITLSNIDGELATRPVNGQVIFLTFGLVFLKNTAV